ncbi:uncharacterized protein LAJ45_11051 [Morchella importuna]|uniref:uncharacterized protein n=1 Tax=Morchella importuna TaxID=1174673 RepID=UPI001E8CBB49|nr:uncharacterized protein LAJ45_11051 [Morchella importuna]KAH8144930.1 hypothetical protein LAJ45_11051 [Morchella importuna]
MSTPPPGRKIVAPKSKLNNPKALPTFTGAPGPPGSTTQFTFNSPGSSPPVAALKSYGGANVTATPAISGGLFGTRKISTAAAAASGSMFATAFGADAVTTGRSRATAPPLFGGPSTPPVFGGGPTPASSSPLSSPFSDAPKTSIFGGAAANLFNAPKPASAAPFVNPFATASSAPPVYNPSFSPLYPTTAQVPGLTMGLFDKPPPASLFGAPASGVTEGYNPFVAPTATPPVYNPFAAPSTTAAAVPVPTVGHFNTPSPSATYNPSAAPSITTTNAPSTYNPFIAPTITTATPVTPATVKEPTDISALIRRIKQHIPSTNQSAPSKNPFNPPTTNPFNPPAANPFNPPSTNLFNPPAVNLFNPPAKNPFNTPSTPPPLPTHKPFIAPVPPNTATTTPGIMDPDFAKLAAIMREIERPLPPAQLAQPAPSAFLSQTTITDTTTPTGLPQGHGSVNAAATTSTTPAGWPPVFGATNSASTGSGGSTLFGQAQNTAPASSAGYGSSSSLFGQTVPTPTPPAPAPAGGVFSSVLPTAAATTGFSFEKAPALPQADVLAYPTDTRAPSDPASLFQTAPTKSTAAPATSAPATSAPPLSPAVPPVPPFPRSTTSNPPTNPLTPITSTFPPFPPLPTYLTPTTSLSDATTDWTATLEAHIETFLSHGALLRNCDTTLLAACDAINDLTLATSSAEAQSATHDRALDRHAADQKRMEEILDWYEAFINAQERAPAPVDAEREVMLGRLLGASERVDEMVRGAEEMVGVLNEAGEKMRGVGGPLTAVVTILNDHLATLVWVDGQTAMLNEKVAEAKEAAARSIPDAEGDAQFSSAARVPWAE